MNALMTAQKLEATRLSVISKTSLVLVKLFIGILMGSVAILSEAIHSVLDLLASIVASMLLVKPVYVP
jgi:divalent metal cation (Fe/Co/Zn/Cd) transporter